MLENQDEDRFEMSAPPAGAWIRRDAGTLTIGATTRSMVALFMVPFMMVWSGGSLGGIYGSQIQQGQFDPFMSLFGIPFLIGSIFFWWLAMMAIFGKVELSLHERGGTVFTGIGTVGISQKFEWREISSAKERGSNFRYPGSQDGVLLLEGKKRISFGSGVREDRRYYLLKSIKKILYEVKSGKAVF